MAGSLPQSTSERWRACGQSVGLSGGQSSDSVHRICPLCGRDNTDESPLGYSQDRWKLKRCSQCDLIYLENAPAYEALESDFAWEKTYQREKKKRREGQTLRYLFSDAAKMLKKLLRGGGLRAKERRFIRRHIRRGRMLDVGCGSGRTLIYLPQNLVPYGIEISPHLAKVSQQYCERRGGHVVRNNAVDGLGAFEADFFDGIMMRAFLEHETQPRRIWRRMNRLSFARILATINF